MCISAFLSLFGCKNHILDGPGMVNKAKWTEFTLSSSGSYAQYNYSFTVKDSDDGAFATGYCRDEEGNIYENKSGIPVPSKTMKKLRELGLDELEDVPESKPIESGDMELPIPLDMDSVDLSVVYYTDLVIEKAVTTEISMKVYDILLPLFAKHGK